MTVQLWIEYPTEPKELLLAWQAPSFVPDRLRWAVGKLARSGGGATFDYLKGDEFSRLNLGRSVSDLEKAGFAGYPAFDMVRREEGPFRHHVLEAFLRRVPPVGRPDFGQYLQHFHIRAQTRLSPLALLAVTEARLPSDGFSLIDPLDPCVDRVDLVFEIAGFRYFVDCPTLQPGDALGLERRPGNPKDPNAVEVLANGHAVGFVNRLQAPTIGTWLRQRSVECWVARVNGRPDAQTAYAFLQVRPAEQSIAA